MITFILQLKDISWDDTDRNIS